MIITIDGPAGTGKSTIAKRVAEAMGFTYFDTGAMYRAVTLVLLDQGIDLNDEESVLKTIEDFSFRIKDVHGEKHYFIGSRDVTKEIRTQRVNAAVSQVAAMSFVRELLWKIQRTFATEGDAVFEGRDMGSVVFPNADAKFFLTATPEVRAQRRLTELLNKSPQEAEQFDQEKMGAELKRRDQFDSSRTLAPLTCPKDALVIDTSDLTIEQIVEKVLESIEKKSVKKLKSASFLYRFVIFVSKCFFKIFYRHKVYGLEHFIPGGAILAANHTSFWDPPAIAISWPEEVHFLARESLFKNPLFGSFIRAVNTHPVSGTAGDVAVFKTIINLLKQGKKVILFPEGARSRDGQFTSVKPGIALLLSRSEAAVIPTYLHGIYEIWKRDRKFPKLHGRSVCVFGSPIYWETYVHLGKKEAQEAIARAIEQAILNLKAWYEAGAQGTPP